jgi:hypothetical protein
MEAALLLVVVKCLLRKAIPLLRGIKEQRREIYRSATALDASKRRVTVYGRDRLAERDAGTGTTGKSPSAQVPKRPITHETLELAALELCGYKHSLHSRSFLSVTFCISDSSRLPSVSLPSAIETCWAQIASNRHIVSGSQKLILPEYIHHPARLGLPASASSSSYPTSLQFH